MAQTNANVFLGPILVQYQMGLEKFETGRVWLIKLGSKMGSSKNFGYLLLVSRVNQITSQPTFFHMLNEKKKKD